MAWIEKYRPQTFEEIIGQIEISKTLKNMCETVSIEDFPHLLFSGIAGVGKTTMAYVIARKLNLLDEKNNISDIYEFNTSLDRGIGFVRDKFVELAKIIPINNKRKIIFLDEFDNMTKDAQEALRRIMEQYSNKTIFILSVNNKSKVIDPIVSRCLCISFDILHSNELIQIADKILENEDRQIDRNQLEKLSEMHISARNFLNDLLWLLCGGKFEDKFNIDEYIKAIKTNQFYVPEKTITFEMLVKKVVKYLEQKGIEKRRRLVIRILDPIMLNPYYERIDGIAKEWLRYQLQQNMELI